MTSDLQTYITEKLRAMQQEKVKAKSVPSMVTKQELFSAIDKDIKDVLNKMYVEKKIRVHKTIHAPIKDYVELTD